jgi:hypothetical protein
MNLNPFGNDEKRTAQLVAEAIGTGVFTQHEAHEPVYILAKRFTKPGCKESGAQYRLAAINERFRIDFQQSWIPASWVTDVRWALTRRDVTHPKGSGFGVGDLVQFKEARSRGRYRIEHWGTNPGKRGSRQYHPEWDLERDPNSLHHLNTYILVNVLTGHASGWAHAAQLELIPEEEAS